LPRQGGQSRSLDFGGVGGVVCHGVFFFKAGPGSAWSDNVRLSNRAQAEPGPALEQENPPEMTADTPHTPEIQAPALPAPPRPDNNVPVHSNAWQKPPGTTPAAPRPPRPDNNVPVHLERLAETARDCARGAKAAATQRAYAADWRHYTAWCRRRGLDPELEALPPDPQVVGLYLAASASEPPAPGKKPNAVRTI
jgi:hypothetical protein